jgi:hypothetical protein
MNKIQILFLVLSEYMENMLTEKKWLKNLNDQKTISRY